MGSEGRGLLFWANLVRIGAFLTVCCGLSDKASDSSCVVFFVFPSWTVSTSQKESVCCTTTAVPGLSCTYRVPRPVAPKVCFLQAGICRKDWGADCPEPIVLQPWQAKSAWPCNTVSREPFLQRSGWVYALSYEGLPLRNPFWTHSRRAHELHSLGYVPFLSPPPPPLFFFAEPEANGKFVLG